MRRRILAILSLLLILVMVFTMPACRKDGGKLEVPEDDTSEIVDNAGDDGENEDEDNQDQGNEDQGNEDQGNQDQDDTDKGDKEENENPPAACTHPDANKSYTSLDATNHKVTCSCGAVVAETEAHIYDSDTDTTCNKCNYTRTVSGGNEGGTETPCTHATKTYESIDENNHKEKCSSCQTVTVASEPHVYDNDTDTTCNKCLYERTISSGDEGGSQNPPACTHPEENKSWESIDENNHKQVCSCGETIVASEAHVYDDDTDTTCNKCLYERTVSGGEGGGTQVPTEDLSAPIEGTAAHTHSFTFNTGTNSKTCTDCGVTFATAATGNKVTLGDYQNEDITWTILKVDGNKALVVSDKILDAYKYDADSNTYAESDIDVFLNGTFKTNAFSATQQSAILTSKLGANGETERKIFVLSTDEVDEYGQLISKTLTAYAADQVQATGLASPNADQAWWWWLRTPADNPNGQATIVANAVKGNASMYQPYGITLTSGGIVPAMWIDLSGECSEHHCGADDVCDMCGTICEHNYDNGDCTECEKSCPNKANHTDNTKCDICGYGCAHDGEFTWVTINNEQHQKKCNACQNLIIGSEADHNFNGDNKCDECEYTCTEHNWENGVCSVCRVSCDVEHATQTTHNCSECNAFLKHTFEINDGFKTCTDENCDLTLAGTNIGDKVTFGSYYQSNATDKEAISWTVLKVENGKALVVADKILDVHSYNGIDAWLNDEFKTAAFNEIQSSVINGNISLLSNEYTSALVTKYATEYAITKINGSYDATNGAWWWILPTVGNDNNRVKINGDLHTTTDLNQSVGGVVPAMWIDLTGECATHNFNGSSNCTECDFVCVDHVEGTPANCTTTAICSICGQSYGNVAHDFDTTKWVKIDENTHGHKCNNCGEFTDVASHDVVEGATCTEDDVCACDHVLEAKLGHNYNVKNDNYLKAEGANCQTYDTYYYACANCGASSEGDTDSYYNGTECGDHSYTVVNGYKGADGHANKCEYCNAHETPTAHNSSGAATETVAETCTVCGYVITPALNHTHSESSEWEYDDDYHWHDCIGNDGQEYGKAEHTYDNACDTTCNGGCGYVRTITHDYTKLQTSDSEHWYICSVCDAEDVGSRTAHNDDSAEATCKTLAVCSCGTEWGTVAADNHTGTLDWVKDATTHTKEYDCCGADVVANEAHEWENGVCSECEYVCVHDLAAHEACDTCDVAKAHVFNKGTCTGCGINVKGANVGDQIIFGSYEQDNDTTNGAEAITWTIVDKDENGNILILSDYILDAYEYDVESTSYENSMIREWLTTTFMNNAFSADEQKAMFVNTADTLNAQDKIFLISNAQALKIESANRAKLRTAYAQTKFANNWWWLGESSPKAGNACAYAVKGDGTGNISDGYNYVTGVDAGGVVPAMWISLNGECAPHAYGLDNVCDVCGYTCNHDSVTLHEVCAECGCMVHNYDANNTCSCGITYTSKEVGGQVTFGNYQGNDINWTIIDTDESGRVLVLADEILDACTHAEIEATLGTIKTDAFMNNSHDVIVNDELFLITKEQAQDLFEDDAARMRTRTEYAQTKCEYDWWWLGSAGKDDNNSCAVKAAGSIGDGYAKTLTGGIVPAMWIQL